MSQILQYPIILKQFLLHLHMQQLIHYQKLLPNQRTWSKLLLQLLHALLLWQHSPILHLNQPQPIMLSKSNSVLQQQQHLLSLLLKSTSIELLFERLQQLLPKPNMLVHKVLLFQPMSLYVIRLFALEFLFLRLQPTNKLNKLVHHLFPELPYTILH